jgi:nickel/cobalt exporter
MRFMAGEDTPVDAAAPVTYLGAPMPTLDLLLTTAVGVGFIHTLIGIDHSLPFVAIGRARGWTLRRVLGLTTLCGLGHVASSVLLGVAGIGLGVALDRLAWIETARGELMAWLLIGFGLAYATWSVMRRGRSRRHDHGHPSTATIAAWSLFVIFVLGPCEPLIPLLMVPALTHGAGAATLVATAFGLTTVLTMLAVVALSWLGLGLRRWPALERHADTFAGLAVAASGLGVRFLGL